MSLPTEETSGRQSPERTCSHICSSSSTQLLSSELKGELPWVCWHFDRRSTGFSDSKYLSNPFISSLIAKVALFLISLLLQIPQYCIFKILLNQSFIKMLQWLKIKSKNLNQLTCPCIRSPGFISTFLHLSSSPVHRVLCAFFLSRWTFIYEIASPWETLAHPPLL